MLKVIKKDIWSKEHFRENCAIVVPTNGWVNKDGNAVMGAGVALQASKLIGGLKPTLGKMIKEYGNVVFFFPIRRDDKKYNIVTFPTKHSWKDKANIDLINKSCLSLKSIAEQNNELMIYMPKVGCGNGKLDWNNDVEPIVNKHLSQFSDRITIVDNESGNTKEWRGDNEQNKRDDDTGSIFKDLGK